MDHFTRVHPAAPSSIRAGGIGVACGALALVAACVPSGEDPDGSGVGTPPPPSTAPPVTGVAIVVQTHEVPGLGSVLTGPNGRTVYLFGSDRSSEPTCLGGCAEDWPPLTTSSPPAAGPAVNPALLTTTQRPDGSTQVVYNGHPLHYYIGDDLPGQANGQTVFSSGGTWYVISPAGEKIDRSAGAGGY